MPTAPPPADPRPILAVLAVVIREGKALLVQRANPPDAGLWGFPGGKVDLGETLLAAAERELLEETGVVARALRVFDALDAFDHDPDGRLRRQFALVAVICDWQSGEPVAADDALAARWVELDEIETLALSADVASLARRVAGLTPA